MHRLRRCRRFHRYQASCLHTPLYKRNLQSSRNPMSIISSPSRFAGAITGTGIIGDGIGTIGITVTGVGGIVIGATGNGLADR